MDPDAALAELLAFTSSILDQPDTVVSLDLTRITELIHALDGWLMTGGYLPIRWGARD